MNQTFEGVIDSLGQIKLPTNVRLPAGRRALVTILDENFEAERNETTLLSQEALAEDWLREEEDDAWQHLQTEQ